MSGKRKAIRTVWSAEKLSDILKSEDVIGFTVWSDGSATIFMGRTKPHLEVTVDIWEDFNLKYNFYEVIGKKLEKTKLS